MDEARRVLERLERIEKLRGGGAPAAVLLGEVRALLSDGERWLASERPRGWTTRERRSIVAAPAWARGRR
jgi:hypothetical protein